jgi:hypothetical protein
MARGKRPAENGAATAAANLPLSDAGRHRIDPGQRQLDLLRNRFAAACARFDLYGLAESAAEDLAEKLARWPDRGELTEIIAELEEAPRNQLCALLQRYAEYAGVDGFRARPEIVHSFDDGFTIERVTDPRSRNEFAELTTYDAPVEAADSRFELYVLRQPTGEPEVFLEIDINPEPDPAFRRFDQAWVVVRLEYRWDPNFDVPEDEEYPILRDLEAVDAGERHMPIWVGGLRDRGIGLFDESYELIWAGAASNPA